jgi:RNA polymerase sigma-70 factor (ECF subfamily)
MSEAWTDAELLERAAEGDESAFQLLYQRHRDPVFRFAYRLLGSEAQAEDTTHDCFLNLLQNPRRFDSRQASLRTYLCAAARNLALKEWRPRKNAVAAMDDLEGEPVSVGAPESLRRLLDEELASYVRKAIAGLPYLQREALILFEYEEMPLAEIAVIVGADVGTVKSRLWRAREHLRKMLRPYFENRSQCGIT